MEDLQCPFPSGVNPGTEAAHERTHRWAVDLGLVHDATTRRQVASERFTWLVGHFYPSAQTRELQLISDFTSWLFWHDDACDETALGEDPSALAHQFDCLLGVLTRRRPPRSGNPFDLAMADLRDRFEDAAPGWGWFARMVSSTEEYFEACVWEAANRQGGLTPNVDSYVDMRRCAGGMYIYADFIELVGRTELPLIARRQVDVRRLVQIACNVACWHNDLFSLEKEVARGDVHNLAVVLARQHGLSLSEGRAMAVDRCNREVADFLPIARRLPPYGPDVDRQLASYKQGLGSLMRGNLDWSRSTERYRRRA